MNFDALPVLMYHSVKYQQKNSWIHKHLSLTLKEFSRHIRTIHLCGFKTFFMDDAYLHLKGEKKLPVNSLVLTFDDGYADNWMFAFPLMKKYNIKGTIWVNPDFVNNDDSTLRPTLEDYWAGNITLEELNEYDGFLNWAEMNEMEKSGLVEIHSHTMTHTQYPVSDEIIDFVSPKSRIDWLHWNLYPEQKPYFLSDNKSKLPLGYPVYKTDKAIVAKRVIENGALSNALVDFVSNSGGEKFFDENNWKDTLNDFSKDFKKKHSGLYRIETKDEYLQRLKVELLQSKLILEKNLNKKINHLCWPFGAWNEEILELACKYGYDTTTAKGEKNIFGKRKYSRVDRIAWDNPKYQTKLFYPYAIFKILRTKI